MLKALKEKDKRITEKENELVKLMMEYYTTDLRDLKS
jgi:hypothetical protein